MSTVDERGNQVVDSERASNHGHKDAMMQYMLPLRVTVIIRGILVVDINICVISTGHTDTELPLWVTVIIRNILVGDSKSINSNHEHQDTYKTGYFWWLFTVIYTKDYDLHLQMSH